MASAKLFYDYRKRTMIEWMKNSWALSQFSSLWRVSSEVLIQKQPHANDGHSGCVIFLSIFRFMFRNIDNNNLHEFIPSSKNKLSNQFWLSSWKRWVCVWGLNFAWFTSLSKCFWCCCELRLNSNEAALITRSSHTHLFNKNKEILLCISIKSLSLQATWWRLHLLTIN